MVALLAGPGSSSSVLMLFGTWEEHRPSLAAPESPSSHPRDVPPLNDVQKWRAVSKLNRHHFLSQLAEKYRAKVLERRSMARKKSALFTQEPIGNRLPQ